jgi:hypothetical protein
MKLTSPASCTADVTASSPMTGSTPMVDRAADFSSDSTGRVNDNERRWRAFHQRVVEIVGDADERTEVGP